MILEQHQLHRTDLIKRCEQGDTEAQFKVYEQYYKAMLNTAYRIVGDRFEAEDVMQESFLAAFTKLHTFSGDVSFGAWLKRIVVNKSITILKKNSRMEMTSLEVVKEQKAEIESVDYSILNIDDLKSALEELKSNYKLALTLNLIEGYDAEEISQIMDISYENSRTTISRAKNKLRQLLEAKICEAN